MDPEAPALDEYLGEVGRIGIDLLAERGDIEGRRRHPEVHDPLQLEVRRRQRLGLLPRQHHPRLRRHRRLAGADAAQRGALRPAATRRASSTRRPRRVRPRHRRPASRRRPDGPRDAAAASTTTWREQPRGAGRRSAPSACRSSGHPHIFPNIWITRASQVSLRLPEGPDKTEIWWFTFLDDELPPRRPARRSAISAAATSSAPPACSSRTTARTGARAPAARAASSAGRYPAQLRDEPRPRRGHRRRGRARPASRRRVNEHAQLWHYRAGRTGWRRRWDDLRANHSRLGDRV